MLEIALTGNIGSGKTTVAKVFEVIGIPVFNADTEAKKLYAYPEVLSKLVSLFSEKILDRESKIDFKKLASIIFVDSKALKEVIDIIHPLVLTVYDEWKSNHQNSKYIIHEAAIIFENNLQSKFDLVINVSAEEELRIERVIKRDSQLRADVIKRVQNQMSDSEKSKLSDYVIYNNNSDFVIPQVLKIHKEITGK